MEMLQIPAGKEGKEIDYLELGFSLLENSGLPEELKESWADKLEEAEDPKKIYKEIQEIINKRKKLNSDAKSSESRFIVYDETVKEKKEKDILKTVEAILKNKSESIGRGATAEVYVKKIKTGHSQYCFKFIYNIHAPEYHEHNDIKKETEFLLKLHNLNIKGVKVPEPIGYIETNSAHVLIMEKLNAVTLSSVLEEGVDLPENFQADEFFKKLEEFVQEMHKHRIHHRDLHSGNIMIDMETGEPCIIDFGRAKEFVIEPQEPETYYLEFKDKKGIRFVDDLAKIREYKQTTLKYLNK